MTFLDLPAWYAPRYCEENVWRLLANTAPTVTDPHALFISNASRACPLWAQRAAPSPEEPVVWDYHVVMLARLAGAWRVWDLDSRLPSPCPAGDWLQATFPHSRSLDAVWQPRFRMVTHAELRAHFASDRSHMRTPEGTFASAPPPYPPIATATETMTLFRFVDMETPYVGELMDLSGLRARLRA